MSENLTRFKVGDRVRLTAEQNSGKHVPPGTVRIVHPRDVRDVDHLRQTFYLVEHDKQNGRDLNLPWRDKTTGETLAWGFNWSDSELEAEPLSWWRLLIRWFA